MTTLRLSRAIPALPVLTALALALLLLSGCNEDSIERSIGNQSATAVEREYGVNNDPVLNSWLNTLGHSLLGQSHRQNIPYSFKVVNTDMVNAFAAPYGHVYVTRGLLGFIKTEDELAFVVGHEVGHVSYRHSIKSLKQGLWFNIGTALAGSKSEGLSEVLGLGAGLMMLHYSRGDEQQADWAGSAYSYGAGYDPDGGIGFFTKLQAEYEKDTPSRFEHLLLTHPPTASRLAAQKNRPETNLKDPAVASRIGRSYARRYAFATATSFYKTAINLKPEAVATRLALAEAYNGVGQYDLARSEYQSVLQTDAANLFAASGIQALASGANRPRSVSLLPVERQQAQALLTQVSATENRLGTLSASAQSFQETTSANLKKLTGTAKEDISSMLSLSDRDQQLTEKGQEAFVLANGAVSAANESAFTVEAVTKDTVRLCSMLRDQTVQVKSALQQAAAGSGQSGDVAIYQRSLAELGRSASALDMAMTFSQQATPLVQGALEVGSYTVSALNNMLAAKEPDKYVFTVKANATDTRQRADAALAAVAKAKQMSTLAEARAVLARLNLAALGASPAVRQAYDGYVGRFCGVLPISVAELRSRGLGYGDAGFVLMASRAGNVPADRFTATLSSGGVITSMADQRIAMEGPVVLLRLVANGLDREAQARNQ